MNFDDGLRYEDMYYADHNRHLLNTFRNMVVDTFGVSAFVDRNVNRVDVYGVTMDTLKCFVNDIGFGDLVWDYDYPPQYGYDEYQDPITDDTSCVQVGFNQALYDLDDF